MTVTANWEGSCNQVIRLTIQDSWTWDEYYAATGQVIRMTERVNRQVDFIVDIQTIYVPAGAFHQIEPASLFFRLPQSGFAVFVGARGYIRILISVFCHLYPSRARWVLFAPDIEEAHHLLATRVRLDTTYGEPDNRAIGLA